MVFFVQTKPRGALKGGAPKGGGAPKYPRHSDNTQQHTTQQIKLGLAKVGLAKVGHDPMTTFQKKDGGVRGITTGTTSRRFRQNFGTSIQQG